MNDEEFQKKTSLLTEILQIIFELEKYIGLEMVSARGSIDRSESINEILDSLENDVARIGDMYDRFYKIASKATRLRDGD